MSDHRSGPVANWVVTHSTQAIHGWEDFEQQVEQLFTDLIETRWRHHQPPSGHPAIDIRETSRAYILTADLPGLSPHDINLDLHRNRLTLSGTRHDGPTIDNADTIVRERFVGRFSRQFTLAHQIRGTHVERTYANGIFRVVLPKAPAPSDTHTPTDQH